LAGFPAGRVPEERMRGLRSSRSRNVCAFVGITCVVMAAVALSGAPAQETGIRYLKFGEVRETLELNSGSGLPGSEIRDEKTWDEWIRQRDVDTRARIDNGIEDSIVNLAVFGTSFTSEPRIADIEAALTRSGEPTDLAKKRIADLSQALQSGAANERLEFVREFLTRKGIASNAVLPFLVKNLRRLAAEQASYREKLQKASRASDPAAVYLVRGDLYYQRGLSVDTSLLPNYALEETLHAMFAKGVLPPRSIARVAIIGPGLDFADKRQGYDFYPVQTLQPFAVLEATLRLGLADPRGVDLDCFDLNSAVLLHLARVAAAGRAGQGYTIQLSRENDSSLNSGALSYWERFGQLIGTPVPPLRPPPNLTAVSVRAIRVNPALVARLAGYDMNVIAQTLDLPPEKRFDLVVATNVLVYYDRLQQAIAMANIARIMRAGGTFLANSVLTSRHSPELEYLGRRTTIYAEDGSYGDDVVVYRRR
jgi:SAM-dependent methyltransferase